jgi:hypothetical protein
LSVKRPSAIFSWAIFDPSVWCLCVTRWLCSPSMSFSSQQWRNRSSKAVISSSILYLSCVYRSFKLDSSCRSRWPCIKLRRDCEVGSFLQYIFYGGKTFPHSSPTSAFEDQNSVLLGIIECAVSVAWKFETLEFSSFSHRFSFFRPTPSRTMSPSIFILPAFLW